MAAPPVLVAERSSAHLYASGFARFGALAGLLILAGLALVGIGWTLLFAAMLALTIRNALVRRGGGWSIDRDGPDAVFAFGPAPRQRVRVADVGGVIVVHLPGATSRGIPVTRDSEQWRLVGHDGATVGVASTAGLDPELVRRFRERLPVLFVPVPVAKRAGILPADTPWWVRHPGIALSVFSVAAMATMLAVVLAPSYWG